jgi:NADH-quinone oxidoreductase subunit L
MVNGSAKLVGWLAGTVRWLQTGFVYNYAFAMIIGVFVFMFFWVYDLGELWHLLGWRR